MHKLARLAIAVLLAGCASSQTTRSAKSAPPAPAATAPEPAPSAPPTGTLFREDVLVALEAGLGRFLQHIEVEPVLAEGRRFVGWRVVALRPAEYWQGVDLRPGDVILDANGLPLERDSQAHAAFQALREASELRVRYLRDGAERMLHFAIAPRAAE